MHKYGESSNRVVRWNPNGPPPVHNLFNQGAYHVQPIGLGRKFDMPTVVVYEGSQNTGCDVTPKDRREQIQRSEASDLYPAYLILISNGLKAIDEAIESEPVGDEKINDLVKRCKGVFLELMGKGIMIEEHAVFGPLYRDLMRYELPADARLKVEDENMAKAGQQSRQS